MKTRIVAEWKTVLSERLSALQSSQTAARSGTRVDGEHRPSNRGERAAVTSQGYLAHGLGERALALQENLDNLEEMGTGTRSEVVVGALLTLSFEEASPSRIVLLPGGDATILTIDQQAVQVLSASSPIARQLRYAEPGDALEIERGGRFVEVEILSIE